MRQYVIVLVVVALVLFPLITDASVLLSNASVNSSTDIWNAGGATAAFQWNLGQMPQNESNTFLGIAVYNPSSSCAFGLAGAFLAGYSDSNYLNQVALTNVGDLVSTTGTPYGSGNIPVNTTTTAYVFALHHTTSSLYYALQPTCSQNPGHMWSLSYYHNPVLVNNQTTTLLYTIADNYTDAYNNVSSTAQAGVLSGSFIYPINSISTPDFLSWLLNIVPATSTDLVNIQVRYGTNNSQLTFEDDGFCSGGVNCSYVVLQKKTSLNATNNFSATTTWYAQPSYQENCSGGIGSVYSCTQSSTGALISFVVNPQASHPTSGLFSGAFPQTFNFQISASSTGSNPYQCNGALDISGCLLNVVYAASQFLFTPSNNALAYLQTGVSGFEQAPPFNLVFGTVTAIQNGASSVATSTNELDWNYNIDNGMSQVTTTLAILSATTLSSWLGMASKNLIFQWEDVVMYALSLFGIVMTVWHWWHKINAPKKHVN